VLLKDQLHGTLDLTCSGGAVVLANLAGGDTEDRGADGVGGRRGEVRVVENVVALGTQDDLESFKDGLGLLEDDIGIDEAGAVELVTADRRVLAEGSVGEGGSCGTGDDTLRSLLPSAGKVRSRQSSRYGGLRFQELAEIYGPPGMATMIKRMEVMKAVERARPSTSKMLCRVAGRRWRREVMCLEFKARVRLSCWCRS